MFSYKDSLCEHEMSPIGACFEYSAPDDGTILEDCENFKRWGLTGETWVKQVTRVTALKVDSGPPTPFSLVLFEILVYNVKKEPHHRHYHHTLLRPWCSS